MSAPAEAQFDAVVDQALALQPLAHAGLHEQIHRALLEDAGAHAMLDVVAAPRFDDHRLDALPVQQVGKQQSRGTRTDDADLRTHLHWVPRFAAFDLDAFDDHGDALAHADAHRAQCVPAAGPLQLIERRRH